MALQPDQKIVVAGTAINGYEMDFAVSRYGNGFTGVQTTSTDKGVALYPNPSDGRFEIVIPDDLRKEELCYVIKDITGNILLSGTTDDDEGKLSIEMTDATAGLYFIEITNKEKALSTTCEKFSIIK